MNAEETVGKMLGDAVALTELASAWLGVRLGLYEALAEGAADARTLAERAGVHPRYAREWLEQQGVAGMVEIAEDHEDPYARRFSLGEGPATVLLDADSPYYMGTLPGFALSMAEATPRVAGAFRSGGGVPFSAYGEGARHGIGGLNRADFLTFAAEWVATLPDVRERLAGGAGRILDLGCGTGWSSIALAEAFPGALVDGIDLDERSVKEAGEHALTRGLDGRVTFRHGDAAEIVRTAAGSYDLVCLFQALHDMADPVAVLRTARGLLAPGGAVLIGDQRVADGYGAVGDLMERLNYGCSVLHCLPATRAEGTAVEAGTVLRAGTVREYAAEAGYGGFAELPIEHDVWRFYRLDAV
ncbi:class I SAM-dependent methyltransferase [Actinocorallia sp. B10E7]|uniref:class I SAM-dependent methyltransferase n=1 Tax=Actinocorallia sp. B10E7 TaxID=3153558 RepID=UPI00325EF874